MYCEGEVTKASITAHLRCTISDIDKRLYRSFSEHMGRAVYTGNYEPDHPKADETGMRTDVLDLVRELDTPICRCLGGNFVSAYNCKNGIGFKEDRSVRSDLAWRTSRSNRAIALISSGDNYNCTLVLGY